ncbi:unnamed protein product, partial [Psylliodes chrysocephalus]
QDYIYTGQPDGGGFIPYQQNHNQYINPSEIIPFRQAPAGFQPLDPPEGGSYLHPDLQTSDLPVHLRQSLPQYRFPSTPRTEQPINFQQTPYDQFSYQNQNTAERLISSPSAFQTQNPQNLRPTTLRPNYPHLFIKNHNRDPSKETFLGEITIDDPAQPPVQYDDFRSSKPYPEKSKEFNDVLEENGGNSIGGAGRPSFLNHRTRILAPDPSKESNKAEISEYFVDTNGEIYSSQNNLETTQSTVFSTQATSFDRKSVNRVKSKKTILTKRPKSVDIEPLLEEPLKYNFGANNDDEVEVIKSSNLSGHSQERFEDMLTKTVDPLDNAEYRSGDIFTSRENNERGNVGNNIQENESGEEIETKYENLTKDKEDPSRPWLLSEESTEPAEPLSIKMPVKPDPEIVTSVVTSKTVVNNTVVGSATPIPSTTSPVKTSTESSILLDNTTDAWVVIASVQTSRSVSGARYLPSSIVEQDTRVKLLNEHSMEENLNDTVNDSHVIDDDDEEFTTEYEDDLYETTTVAYLSKIRTSTESLNDKLDRVQSDLSSGLLTGGLGNNIAVIKEHVPEKGDMTMDDIKLTTTTKAPYPQVNIRKYSPNNRKATTRRPRPRPGLKAKKPFDPNQPQGDQPQKKPDDLASILPPGYKLNASDERSSKLLEDILSRVKPNKIENKVENKTEEASTELVQSISTTDSTSLLKNETQNTTPSAFESLFKNTKADDISKFLPPGYKIPNESQKSTTESSGMFKNTKSDAISKFLPPGYKLPKTEAKPSTTERSIFKNTKADDLAKFLPPGFKLHTDEGKSTTESSIFKNTKVDDLSKFLPPGYKLTKSSEEKTTEHSIFKNTKSDDILKFLPPGYKVPKSEEKPSTESSIFKNTKADDVSKFLPPGFKVPKYKSSTESSILKNTKADDVSKFLPPGYKSPKSSSESQAETVSEKGVNSQTVDISAFLPPGFKLPSSNNTVPTNLLPANFSNMAQPSSTTSKPAGKVVFPSRPGGPRKTTTRTTHKPVIDELPRNTPPTIHKGWPVRVTTEFTGWPTPSTTPISIEKLLEAAKAASTSTTRTVETTVSTTSTTTTTTTTTPKPTTPGICTEDCELAGTIKLVGGIKWVPELLDRNTKEWQVLANEVESQLDYVYSSSSLLNRWYRKIRIDGFSEGSVLVDYNVELNDLGRRVDTQEIKKLFHESLDDALSTFGSSNREGKAINESMKLEGKLALGSFVVDPAYTDFLVLPKRGYPTVGYAENDVLLPQWAIAVIVIGLASLLFVIIFGVTVLVNRQKNNKKKAPTPLTEGMLNELNKNHMGGFDNYGAEDLYNMEDVWNERAYEQKPPKKRSTGSIHNNSMSNLYDSWRSEWNGYYYNAYYGNPGSSQSGYNGRRRSDYDTNF